MLELRIHELWGLVAMCSSIIAAPAIGADPKATWGYPDEFNNNFGHTWKSLYHELKRALVYLYRHTEESLVGDDTLEYYTNALLDRLQELKTTGIQSFHFTSVEQKIKEAE
jgi:hypothetical protein